MNAKTAIERHQTCIEILEAVSHFQNMIQLKVDSINGFPGTFPELRNKYYHNIEIYKKCIVRLIQRHDKILNSIQ